MKISSIIHRYVFKEMMPPFVINLIFFTFVFLMVEMLKVMNMVVNYRVGVFTVLIMLVYSTPYFLTYVIPMSVMIAVLLTFLRLSGDNEIVALKSGGMSIYQLLPPVMLFCMLGCLLTLFMTVYGMAWGRLSFKELTYKIVSSNLEIGLKDRTFNDSFEDVVLYMNKIDPNTKELQDIFIEDKRTQNIVSTVVAPRGKLFRDLDEYVYRLILYNGVIYQVDAKNRSTNHINFETYEVRMDIKEAASGFKQETKHIKEMNLVELWNHLNNSTRRNSKYYNALMELHKKFSIPTACFALGLLAVPLGIQSGSTKKSFGLVLGMIFFLIYYLLLTAGLVFGETGACPPVMGMWFPNIVMGALGLYLLVKTANERQLRIIPVVTNLLKGIKFRLHGQGRT
jgi:lipopolysaccharide export system permease protein